MLSQQYLLRKQLGLLKLLWFTLPFAVLLARYGFPPSLEKILNLSRFALWWNVV